MYPPKKNAGCSIDMLVFHGGGKRRSRVFHWFETLEN